MTGNSVRGSTAGDGPAVRQVIAAAFADDPVVADLWDALARRPGTTALVATDGDVLVGHVGLSWGWVDAAARLVDVLILSPLSVAPDRQGRGIGRALVRAALDAATELGAPALFLEGDPRFYGPCGFGPAAHHGFTPPSVRIPLPAFQVALLPSYEPWMTGALVYPETFWAFDAVGLRGDLPDL